MRQLDDLFAALARSRFRSRFRLRGQELAYLRRHGMEQILVHGRHFVLTRLAPAELPNDGRQTPMRGHPIFIAQHATGACCRSCLQKWHHIPAGRALTTAEVDYVLAALERWLRGQSPDTPSPPSLFG